MTAYRFSNKEIALLRHMAGGMADKRIALEMGMSKPMVSVTLWKLRKSLGLQSRVELASFCHLAGLITKKDFDPELVRCADEYRKLFIDEKEI